MMLQDIPFVIRSGDRHIQVPLERQLRAFRTRRYEILSDIICRVSYATGVQMTDMSSLLDPFRVYSY